MIETASAAERQSQVTRSVPSVGSSSVTEVGELAELVRVFDPDTNVVVLPRRIDEALASEARTMLARHHLSVALRLDVRREPRALLIERLGAEVPKLVDDVLHAAQVLGDLTGSDELGVRVAVLDAAMCPRFHADYVAMRLVCTYVGPTTEYLSEDGVDRSHLGYAPGKPADELTGLLRPGARVQRAPVGALVLLKGEGFPGNEGRGAVHRSPAATATDPRLVLTIDPL
jgi:hypothetical protein